MLVQIEITQDIIDRSIPCMPSFCILANGFTSAVAPQYYVTCGVEYFTIRKGDREEGSLGTQCHRQLLPYHAAEQADLFDTRQPVKPFNFEVDIPQEYLPAPEGWDRIEGGMEHVL